MLTTSHTLLDLNKDLLNKEIHSEKVWQQLKTFAEEKQSRTLVIAKLDKSNAVKEGESIKSGETKTDDVSSAINSDTQTGTQTTEIEFSDKVKYYGNTA